MHRFGGVLPGQVYELNTGQTPADATYASAADLGTTLGAVEDEGSYMDVAVAS